MANDGAPPELSMLHQIPLFASLSPEHLEQVRASMTSLELPRGSYIFHQGERGDALHVVVTGMVEAVIDEGLPSEHVVSTFSAGDFLGEVALLTRQPRTASIRARTDARLLTLSETQFEALLEQHPHLSLLINRVLSHRLRTTNEHISRQGPRTSLVVSIDETDDANGALTALVESLAQQLQTDIALVFLGRAPLRGFDASEGQVQRQRLETTSHHIHALTISGRALEAAADATIRERIDHLRAGVGHTMICAGPLLAVARPGLIAHGARALILRGETATGEATCLQTDMATSLERAIQVAPARDVMRSTADVDRVARTLAGVSIGVALSGGAAQGTAHLGVLQALMEAGMPIDMIAGASGGALYGAMVAAGIPVATAQETVIAHTRRNLLDRVDVVVPRFGLIRGKRIEHMIHETLGERQFAELLYPLSVIATDLADGTEVVLDQGSVYQAVRASISIPGVFVPFLLNGRLLVDGGLVNPLPVNTTRAMGADYVIAVHLPAPGKVTNTRRRRGHDERDRYNLLSTVVRSYAFAGDVLAERSAANADVCIQPQVAHFGWRDYRSSPAIIRAGYEAGQAALTRVHQVLPIGFVSAS